MNVAICLSGQSRDVRKTLDNIKNSWTGYNNLDFFIHTWYYDDNKPYRVDTPLDNSDVLVDYIINELSPKSILVEVQKKFDKVYINSKNWNCYHPTKNPNPSQNIQSMFYSIYKSNLLKKQYELENNFKYDCVIRCRFDYLFSRKYDLNEFDLNRLNIKSDCNHNSYSINDHLAVSRSDIMDIYSDMYFNIDKYYDSGIEFNPEVMLGYHIQSNNIEVTKTLGSEESYVSTRDERKNNINS